MLAGNEGEVAHQQQQLLQSIHSMIGQLEAEKRSFLGMLDSSQVRCKPLSLVPCLLDCAVLCFAWWSLLGRHNSSACKAIAEATFRLCCAVLCCAVLCCAVLRCAVLYCAVLC